MNDYAYYKSIGVCPDCGKNPALPGKVHCAHCAKTRGRHAKKHREAHSKASRDFAKRRRGNGLCLVCGKPSDNGIYCKPCAIIRNAKRWLVRRRKRNGTWSGRLWDERTMAIIAHGVLYDWQRRGI